MEEATGVYQTCKKNGTPSYRSSFTYKNKHISLGSFPTAQLAACAYQEAKRVTSSPSVTLDTLCERDTALPFGKYVTLLNFRDNGLYFKTPIYLKNKYFLYYLDQETVFKFDVDDLFYYSSHKIMKRGGHLFVSDFGMQINILSRYGIKNYGTVPRDYRFINGDCCDYRYHNIQIINRYHGVTRSLCHGQIEYTARIHICGNCIIGRYLTETEAAAAYNKAVELLHSRAFPKDFPLNYIEGLSSPEYRRLLSRITLPRKLYEFPIANTEKI